jgi:hypothetical protein
VSGPSLTLVVDTVLLHISRACEENITKPNRRLQHPDSCITYLRLVCKKWPPRWRNNIKIRCLSHGAASFFEFLSLHLNLAILVALSNAMFEPVPSLSRTTKRLTLQPRWQSDGSSEMNIPLTTLSDNDKLPSSSSHELLNAHMKKQSIFGRLGRSAKGYLGPRFAGWRFGVLSFALGASIVLLINIAATISAFTVPSDEKGVFFDGDCVYVKRLNTGLHLAINILSTIILAGSNYTMQCLSAPTRSEIDAAHSCKPALHLDVGILSIRNLSYISKRRKLLWLLLGLSSLPLHLV